MGIPWQAIPGHIVEEASVEHQNFALKLLDYIRSVELISGSTLIGIAEPDTVPVQPDDAHVAYIAGVAQERTVEFLDFIDQDGVH